MDKKNGQIKKKDLLEFNRDDWVEQKRKFGRIKELHPFEPKRIVNSLETYVPK